MTNVQQELVKRRDFLKKIIDEYDLKAKKESRAVSRGTAKEEISGKKEERQTTKVKQADCSAVKQAVAIEVDNADGAVVNNADGTVVNNVDGKTVNHVNDEARNRTDGYAEDTANKITSHKTVKLTGETGGLIKAVKHGKGYQYYIKESGEDRYKYVKSKDKDLVRRIVQTEYDVKVQKTIRREYRNILSLLNAYEKSALESIYESMSIGKQLLIKPVILPDDKYIKMWKEQTYEPLGFRENAPEFYSSKGERMRSKSEVIIANLLDKMHVEYKYEKPLRLKHLGIVHPDFTILNVRERKEIYLEHLGMLDDITYRNNAIMKIRDYENSGYYLGVSLIVTVESLNCPLDIRSVERRIKYILGV